MFTEFSDLIISTLVENHLEWNSIVNELTFVTAIRMPLTTHIILKFNQLVSSLAATLQYRKCSKFHAPLNDHSSTISITTIMATTTKSRSKI